MIVMIERIPTRSHSKVMMPRPCLRPENHVGMEALPASAFSWGDGSHGTGTRRRRRGVCDECLEREAAERARHHAEWRATYVDKRTGKTMRRCATCRKVKELLGNFYVEHRNADGSVAGHSYNCSECSVERITAYRHEMLADPDTAEAWRAQRRAHTQTWRERNPAHYRALQTAYRLRVKADPERHARRLEAERLAYHLRAEREGRTPRTIPNAVRVHPRKVAFPRLPAEPLLRAIERWLAWRDLDESGVRLGVDARTVRRWREGIKAGRMPTTTYAVADAVLSVLGLHLWDVWPEDEYPKIHEALARVLAKMEAS